MNKTACAFAASIGLAATAAALADCTAGTMPVQLQVPDWSASSPVGSSTLSTDDQSIVTVHRTTGGNAILFFREGTSGWALDRQVHLAAVDGPVSVNGANFAIGGPGTLRMYHRSAATGDWNLAEFDNPGSLLGNVQSVAVGPTDVAVVWFSATAGLHASVRPLQPNGTLGGVSLIEDPEPGAGYFDGFGYAMAIDGDLLAVGAFGDSQAGPYVGAVYIYQRFDTDWVMVQKIMPEGASATPGFGTSVSMNGGRLAVGSVHTGRVGLDPSPVSFANGFVNVYDWTGTSFVLRAHLSHPTLPSSTPAGFGQSVAVRGNRLLVGAFQDSYSGVSSGAAYVYDFDGAAWNSSGAIALQSSSGAWFGSAVGLTATAAVAVAPFHNEGRLAAAVFDSCSLPSAGSSTPACLPGIGGLMTYLLRWFQLDAWADFDQSGTITTQDLMSYLSAWLSGC